MKNKFILSILVLITACETQSTHPLIGSWSECRRDGIYKEFNINEHYTTTSLSDFRDHDYDSGISFFNTQLLDTLLIVTSGINVDIINPPDTLQFEILNDNKVLLKDKYGTSELTRITNEGSTVDSANYKRWRKSYLKQFILRAKSAGCVDLRTEEELKADQLIELGEVEDDFEELTEIEE